MKNKLSTIILAVACAVFIASCGGGSVGKKLPNNDYLGDLPNLVNQKYLTDSVREAKVEAEVSKAKLAGKFDDKKAMQIYEKYKLDNKAAEEAYKADIAKLKEKLVGKEIPVEVAEGAGFKVNSSRITGVENNGVRVEMVVEVTDLKEANFSRWGGATLNLAAQLLDKDGNQIGNDGWASAKFSEKADGATGTIDHYLSIYKRDAANFVNFAKIKFIKR